MDSDKKREALDSLKSLKSNAKPRSKRSRWIAPLLLLMLVAAFVCLWRFTDLIYTGTPEPTMPPSTRVKLIDRLKTDFLSATIQKAGEAPYTIKSNMVFDTQYEYVGNGDTGRDYEIDGDPLFALNPTMCSTIANNATALSAAGTVAERVTDFAPYGLMEPMLVIDIQYRDGKSTRLNFGDKVPIGGNYYLRVDEDDTVYTIPANQYDAFDQPLAKLHILPNPATHIEINSVVELLIEQRGKPTIELAMGTLSDEDFEAYEEAGLSPLVLTRPIEHEADATRATELALEVCALTLTDYVGRASTDEELASFGLSEPEAHIRLIYVPSGQSAEDDMVGALGIGEHVLELWFGAQIDEHYSYAAVDRSGDIYKIETSLLRFLEHAELERLVEQYVAIESIEEVSHVQIVGGAKEHVLSITRGEETAYMLDDETLPEEAFAAMYEKIVGMRLDRLIERPLEGLEHARVRFTYRDGREDTLVEYLTYDADYDQIRIGEKNLFLIKKEKVDGLLGLFE